MINKLTFMLAAGTLLASVSSAQFSTIGLSLSPHINGTAWTLDDLDVDIESGSGLGLSLGYGFTESLGAFVEISGASIQPREGDAYPVGFFDVGAFATLGATNAKLKLLGRASLTGFSATVEDGYESYEVTGAGLSLGLGPRYYISQGIALDLDLNYTFGNISQISSNGMSVDIDENMTAARMNLGLTFQF